MKFLLQIVTLATLPFVVAGCHTLQSGVQWSLWLTCFLKSVTGLWKFNVSLQRRWTCFYLAGSCSGCFVHSRIQPSVTFTKMAERTPFCGRTACKWGIDNVQKLGLLQNALCTVVAIEAYLHSLLRVPSDQSAWCVITGSIFIFQVGMSTAQFHLHALKCSTSLIPNA